jgi:hypothetical protein
VTTDVPLAPEVGLILGALAGWLSRRGARTRLRGRGTRRSGAARWSIELCQSSTSASLMWAKTPPPGR